jgi:hypothetical protein
MFHTLSQYRYTLYPSGYIDCHPYSPPYNFVQLFLHNYVMCILTIHDILIELTRNIRSKADQLRYFDKLQYIYRYKYSLAITIDEAF